MPKILVIHGAGMNMRGKVQTEIFGPMTLPQYDERIRGYAQELGLEVEIFHSNIEVGQRVAADGTGAVLTWMPEMTLRLRAEKDGISPTQRAIAAAHQCV